MRNEPAPHSRGVDTGPIPSTADGVLMTTKRFVIERMVLECDGASVTIGSAKDEWSGREQLCVEVVTTDAAGGADRTDQVGAGLPLYCPEPAQPTQPTPPARPRVGGGQSRRPRAVLATAIVAAVALLATVGGAGVHLAPSPRRSVAPTTSVPRRAASPPASPANRQEAVPTGTIDRAVVSTSADLAGRCSQMISAAASALRIDEASLLSTLVAAHAGQTFDDLVDQRLAEARAALVRGPTGGDATSTSTAARVDQLDVAIGDVGARPCSPLVPDRAVGRQWFHHGAYLVD